MPRGIIALIALLALVACGAKKNTNKAETTQTKVEVTDTGKVKVLYLFGKKRCATCIAIGAEAKRVVTQLANKNVTMRSVDFSTPEGEKIADSYEIASSSLLLVKDGEVENLTTMGFRYAASDPEQFRTNLIGEIEKLLEE